MAYSQFTLEMLEERFGLLVRNAPGSLFAETPETQPTEMLTKLLERHLPTARDVGTEAARSSLLVAPILAEAVALSGGGIGFFPGIELNVDRKQGLQGFCDYVIAQTPTLLEVRAPIIAIVEAKREDITAGIPQCVATMYAAQLFNERKLRPLPRTYGAVTSGTNWRFLALHDSLAQVDTVEYNLDDLPQILGIFLAMMQVATSV